MEQEASGSGTGRDDEAGCESADSAVVRDTAGRWQPGHSGNPYGRPALLAGVRELARQHTALAISVLAAIAADRAAPPGARMGAARELLDRGHGRPSGVELVGDLATLSDDELERAALAWDGGQQQDVSAFSDGELDGLVDEP